ncbi:hypothetical protein L5G28_04895 [Gordonia sp. HY285]|uniref:hypothetical protein n=1 Tax=Gordonia liuliyuniae TaxID=2911517 RepID=UPI001F2E2C96|nr:hypothetical protein [Gordonia liuliyuniae]MCF8609498.1 hypothetical protein [Gordonia liuliyuniae]
MKSFFRVCAILVIVLLGGVALGACGDDDSAESGQSLPADFPSDDVPMVEGNVLSATGEGDSWRVTIQGNAADGNPLANATKLLEDDGYEESSRAGDAANQTVLLFKAVDGRTLWVRVGVSADAAGGGSTAFYEVMRTD